MSGHEQPTYLARFAYDGVRLFQTDELRVQRNGKMIRLSLVGRDVLRADGRGIGSNYRIDFERSAAGVKRAVRRLRPDEAEILDNIDTYIADLEDKVRLMREERKRVVAEAWHKGHVVRLQEIEAAITP